MSSEFVRGECLRSGMSIGGETLSRWGGDHKNSDVITSRVIDEMYRVPEIPVGPVLSSRWSSFRP